MLTKPICLVLGAGASNSYGFPTGSELLDLIFGNQPDEWWDLAQRALSYRSPRHFHDEFVSALRSAGSPSIDHFIGKQPKFRDYGRALIAFHISRGENKPRVLQAGNNYDWHNFLLQHIVDGVTRLEDLPALAVVTFNFDRSFEEATLVRLAHLCAQHGEIEAHARARVVKALARWPIVHVHGSLGVLPEMADSGQFRPYEPITAVGDLQSATERIILLDDAQDDSREFARARAIIKQVELVIFLGFAFHRLNCQRVLPTDWGSQNSRVISTGIGMSTGARYKAAQRFAPQRTLDIQPMGNVELLRHFEHEYSN